jgi:hypothetical protein
MPLHNFKFNTRVITCINALQARFIMTRSDIFRWYVSNINSLLLGSVEDGTGCQCMSLLKRCYISPTSWGGVRLSPIGSSTNNWPIVPVSDERWWVWSSRWNENWQGESKCSEKTCPSATLTTTNPKWLGLGLNPGRRGGKSVTNRLRYGMA